MSIPFGSRSAIFSVPGGAGGGSDGGGEGDWWGSADCGRIEGLPAVVGAAYVIWGPDDDSFYVDTRGVWYEMYTLGAGRYALIVTGLDSCVYEPQLSLTGNGMIVHQILSTLTLVIP
jgi:hypothetical protein